MKRQRLNRLSPANRAELNRKLKDAMEASLIRLSHRDLAHQSCLCVKLIACCDTALITVNLTRLRVRTLTHFRVGMTPSMS
jgi:hypothetical protein